MPRPPRLIAKAMSSCSVSLKAFWPVREGRKRCQIASSKGWKRLLITNVCYGPGQEHPFVHETMGECGICRMGLGDGNG